MKVKPYKALVTFSNWIFVPGGGQRRAAFGRTEVVRSDDLLGMPCGRAHAPWSLKITGDRGVLYVPGCRVEAVIRCDSATQTQLKADEFGDLGCVWFADSGDDVGVADADA